MEVLIGSTEYENNQILDTFMRLEGVLDQKFLVLKTYLSLFKNTPVYLGVRIKIFKGELDGKIAYRVTYLNKGIGFVVILDDPSNYKHYKAILKNEAKINGSISLYSFKLEDRYFSRIKTISTKYFNSIYDENWNNLVPFLDNFNASKALDTLKIYLYGLPGSGKTEFVRQIALYCHKPIYSVHVNRLEIILANFAKNSIVLIEEIDKVLINGEFTSETNVPVLLSILDGSMIPNKTIVVTISNQDISGHNNILMRDGRMDIKLKFGLLNKDQMTSVLNKWYPVDTSVSGDTIDDRDNNVWNIVNGKLTIAKFDLVLRHSVTKKLTFDEMLEALKVKCAAKDTKSNRLYL